MDYHNSITFSEINQTDSAFNLILQNANSIKKVANEIKKSGVKHLFLTARGSSNHALIFFKYLCETYTRLTTSFLYPSTVTLYGAKPNLTGGALICCSQSGEATDCIQILKMAKEQNVTTVSITNSPKSPLATLSDHHLYCFCGQEISVAATKTFSAQMLVCALLVSYLSNGALPFEKIFEGANFNLQHILTLKDNADKLSNLLLQSQNCFILSRGICFPVAKECALKLQETCYLNAFAYSCSDFYHGPIAMIQNQSEVILFSPNFGDENSNEFFNQQVDLTEKLCSFGAKIRIITTSEKFKNRFIHLEPIYLGNFKNQISSALLFARFSQFLACFLSCKKGLNPDKPRALKKITLTF